MVTLGLGQLSSSAYELAIGALEAEKDNPNPFEDFIRRPGYSRASTERSTLILSARGGILRPSSTLSPTKETEPGYKRLTSEASQSGTKHGGLNTDYEINSTETRWDPATQAIAGYESLKALKQAEAEALIEGANSNAVVEDLLLQELEALEEYEIAIAEFNMLADENNYLAERRSRLLNLRRAGHGPRCQPQQPPAQPGLPHLAQLADHPVPCGRTNLAAQFAYLTARAAEYELLTPYPGSGAYLPATHRQRHPPVPGRAGGVGPGPSTCPASSTATPTRSRWRVICGG